MRNRIIALPFALALALAPVAGSADDFLALPGLWQTTYRTSEPQVVWHCVDEDQDPWVAFAQLADVPGMSCTRPVQERTSTTLKWKFECKGAATVTSEGSIVFDSPQHYTGSVKLSGTLLGFPLQGVTRIEGQRYAACTSPRD